MVVLDEENAQRFARKIRKFRRLRGEAATLKQIRLSRAVAVVPYHKFRRRDPVVIHRLSVSRR